MESFFEVLDKHETHNLATESSLAKSMAPEATDTKELQKKLLETEERLFQAEQRNKKLEDELTKKSIDIGYMSSKSLEITKKYL